MKTGSIYFNTSWQHPYDLCKRCKKPNTHEYWMYDSSLKQYTCNTCADILLYREHLKYFNKWMPNANM